MRHTKSFDIGDVAHLSNETFIHHCFIRTFRRVCSPSRAKHYLAMLDSGISRDEVMRRILQEDGHTHQSNSHALRKLLSLDGDQFVDEAYRKMLGRPADVIGFEHYSQRLSRGEKKVRVLYDLATSSEGQMWRARNPEVNDFVELLIKESGFHRAIAIKDIWRLLATGDGEFIQAAYRLILRREADAAGLLAYQQAYRGLLWKIRILCSLAYSNEGQRFQKTFPARLFFAFARIALK
jgi:hypothetical protein